MHSFCAVNVKSALQSKQAAWIAKLFMYEIIYIGLLLFRQNRSAYTHSNLNNF